jgi:hypothetical protein
MRMVEVVLNPVLAAHAELTMYKAVCAAFIDQHLYQNRKASHSLTRLSGWSALGERPGSILSTQQHQYAQVRLLDFLYRQSVVAVRELEWHAPNHFHNSLRLGIRQCTYHQEGTASLSRIEVPSDHFIGHTQFRQPARIGKLRLGRGNHFVAPDELTVRLVITTGQYITPYLLSVIACRERNYYPTRWVEDSEARGKV